MQGDPVSLTCFLNNLHHAHVEWKNPEGHILFYNAREAKRDIRIRITTLSQSEFSIRITSVTFKDGGNYTCTQYDDNGAFEQIVEVTVLGQPRISTVKHGKVNVVKCRVEGNHHPPQISWILSNGPEFIHSTIYRDGHTFVSEGSLGVHHVRNRVMVKCLVHHPALYSPPLLAFIKLGQRQKARPSHPHQSAHRSPWGTEDSSRGLHNNNNECLLIRGVNLSPSGACYVQRLSSQHQR
uniref:Ig-like domain-containing protein n=1 Tax=Nothobranchius furzeri TaxID=105023 RepID=A0A8C6NVH7_NOTFU